MSIYACYQCGLCTGICPKRLVTRYSPRGDLERALLAKDELDLWSCLTCGLCSQYCPQGVGYLDFMKEVRSNKKADQDTIAHKSVFNLISQLMLKFPKKSGVPTNLSGEIDPKGPTGYFPGCIDFLDSFLEVGIQFHPIGDAAMKLMNKVGVKPRVMGLKCCGHDELWQGNQEEFEKLKDLNTHSIKESGIKTLVTTCAECTRTFAIDYNLDIEVLHLSQFLEKHLGKLNLKGEGSVTYHDPCRLGRHMEVYDNPRNLITQVKGTNLVELENTREDCQCCGVSAWLGCSTESKALLVNKLDEAERTDAATLLTTCTKCLAHLSCVLNEKPPLKEFQIKVQDLTVFIAEKLA
jgi:heterodisulfide reductase subunit D